MAIEYDDNSKYPLWVDASNLKRRIEDMGNDHIIHCIKYLEDGRKKDLSKAEVNEYLDAFKDELNRRKH